MDNVCVLGATGSVGISTLDVIAEHPTRYKVYALTAHSNHKMMLELCRQHHPQVVVMVESSAAEILQSKIKHEGLETVVLSGKGALDKVAAHDDVRIVMAAIVGAAGLKPSLAAAANGKKVLLANKEALVMSGELFMERVEQSSAILLPIDSEHNAIFQCLPDDYACGKALGKCVKRVLLTASGGPFRSMPFEQLARVTPEQACKHPNWDMGKKISVDSASLMNKGLELIEACWLFNVEPNKIDVHIHPESIVHSMLEYIDGSVLAQLSNPDMRIPIAYGLSWPERIDSGVPALDLFNIAQLNFEKPDNFKFPCLNLAKQAVIAGGTACASLNAANEIAVEAFLKGNIAFTSIPDIIEGVLEDVPINSVDSLEKVLEADAYARNVAEEYSLRKQYHRVRV